MGEFFKTSNNGNTIDSDMFCKYDEGGRWGHSKKFKIHCNLISEIMYLVTLLTNENLKAVLNA